MRIGFSHYKPEKTPSSSTVVLPPFRRLRPSTSSPCTHPPPCSFSIFTSRAHSPPRPSLAFLPLVAAAVAWLRASCSSQLQLHISAQTEKEKKKEGRRKRRTREELGAQVQFEERRGTGMKFESWERRRFRRFRTAKQIFVSARLII